MMIKWLLYITPTTECAVSKPGTVSSSSDIVTTLWKWKPNNTLGVQTLVHSSKTLTVHIHTVSTEKFIRQWPQTDDTTIVFC